MCISGQHLKRLVAGDGSDLHRIKTLLEKPTGSLMPEIVEMKPGDSGHSASLGEVLGDRIRADIPDLPVDSAGVLPLLEDCHGNGGEGDNSLLAVFRIR